MADIWVTVNNSLPILFLIAGLIIVYFIIREIRLMYTKTRMAQVELEKEKLEVIKADIEKTANPFFRVSPRKNRGAKKSRRRQFGSGDRHIRPAECRGEKDPAA